MKKLIDLVFAVALVAPVFADLNETASGSVALAYSTPIAQACLVKYVIVANTGSVTSDQIYLRTSTTAKLTIQVPAAAGTTILDLSDCPVRFASGINYGGADVETNYVVTIVYEKAPGR